MPVQKLFGEMFFIPYHYSTQTGLKMNNTELRLLCNHLRMNGNQWTTEHDNELQRMSRQLDDRMGRTASDLSHDDLMLLELLCLNSQRDAELNQLRNHRRS